MMFIGSLFFLHLITTSVRFGAGLSMFGCYWNDQNNTLSVMQQTTSSTLQCINLCLGENTNYIYAGTEKNPNRCYCGHKLRVQAIADVAECKAPCPLLVTDLCGIHARLAVYNISGLIFPVTLGESVITTESTTKFTNTHRQLTFSTSKVLIDETTTGSIRSTFTKSTYSLVPSSSLTFDETTYLKTSYSAKEGLTVYNSTHTKYFQTTQAIKQGTTTLFSVNKKCTQQNCICGKWSHLNGLNLSRDELRLILKTDLDTTRQNLITDAKTTSAFRNKKISASDNRMSSAVMGYFGIAIICVPIILVVLSDALRICKK